MGEQGIESVCCSALKLGVSSIAICSLGVPYKDTGRQAARAIRSWLEEASGGTCSPPAKKRCGSNPQGSAEALPQKVVYNAAAPRELAGAISILRRWREELYLGYCASNPFSFLESGIGLLQEGEGMENGQGQTGKEAPPDAWAIFSQPVDVPITDAWVPDKDPELWDGEDLTWHTQKAKTVGLYRAPNQLSSVMLLDDLRGYPPISNDPSRQPLM